MASVKAAKAVQAAELCDCTIKLLRYVEGDVMPVERWSMAQPNRFDQVDVSLSRC